MKHLIRRLWKRSWCVIETDLGRILWAKRLAGETKWVTIVRPDEWFNIFIKGESVFVQTKDYSYWEYFILKDPASYLIETFVGKDFWILKDVLFRWVYRERRYISFCHRNRPFISQVVDPIEVEFVIPYWSKVFSLGVVKVPWIGRNIFGRTREIFWLVNWNGISFPLHYPVNIGEDGDPCSALRESPHDDDTFVRLWYAERPSSDLMSVEPDRLPILLWALKTGRFEFLPATYRRYPFYYKNIGYSPVRLKVNIKAIFGDNERVSKINTKVSARNFPPELLEVIYKEFDGLLEAEGIIHLKETPEHQAILF